MMWFAIKLFSRKSAFFRMTGLLLLAAGAAILTLLIKTPSAPDNISVQLKKLADYDYLREARHLAKQQKYAEAMLLCEDIIACDLKGKQAAMQLKKICGIKLNSSSHRIRRIIRAFLSGAPSDDIEETIAAMFSDMLLYGDIRDLAVQGYFSITGQKTDPLIAALAGAGLLTELADTIDWAPALLKALRKSAALPDSLCRNLITFLKTSGVKSPAARQVFESLKNIFQHCNFGRTKNILRHLDSVEAVNNMAKISAKSPSAAHLLARSAGKNTAEAAKKLLNEPSSASFLKRLIAKGPHGITLFLRGTKTIKKGNAEKVLYSITNKLKENMGQGIWLLPAILIAGGTFLLFHRSKKQSPS